MECVHKTDQIYIYIRNVVSVTRDGAGSLATQGLHLRLFQSETDAASHLLPLLPSSLHTSSFKMHLHAKYKQTQLAMARR